MKIGFLPAFLNYLISVYYADVTGLKDSVFAQIAQATFFMLNIPTIQAQIAFLSDASLLLMSQLRVSKNGDLTRAFPPGFTHQLRLTRFI